MRPAGRSPWGSTNKRLGDAINATWFDPATGEYTQEDAIYSNHSESQSFTAPSQTQDWVLLLVAE